MAKEGYKDAWMLYVGTRELAKGGLGHTYHMIVADHNSDLVSEMTTFKFEENGFMFKKKLYIKDTIGWIRPCSVSNDNTKVSTPKTNKFTWKRWYKSGDIAGWEVLDRAAKATQAKLKEIGKDELLTLLQPITTAMREATREQRRLILAEVLLILNS